ncbi:MAG: 50S ribosomal protein L9 [Oscillospiraceae bacterium]
MKVILVKDVKAQGKKGDLINVSDGYATNFLLPKGLAKLATKQAVNELEGKRGAEEFKRNLEEEKAKNIAKRLEDTTIALTAKAGKEGKLFGSITTKDVALALKEQCNIDVDKRKINLPDGIKTCGTHDVKVTLYPNISGKFKVKVSEQ